MKPAKNQRPPKLVMRRETVVVLTSRELVVVRGAGEPTSSAFALQDGANPGMCVDAS